MNKLPLLFVLFLLLLACKKSDNPSITLTETSVSAFSHQLATFSVIKGSKYLIVFESGLGDDHLVWTKSNTISQLSQLSDIVLYDRAGYGKSTKVSEVRNIEKLSSELDSVINRFSNKRKVILVGHSLGGLIIRDYAIKHPNQIAGLFFVDTSHEKYNGVTTTQQVEDQIVATFTQQYGANFGGTQEAKELIEDMHYCATLPNLPNVPVAVVTSMKTDATHTQADRQLWYDAQESLKTDISDFTHISTIQSGHYIMQEEPVLIYNTLQTLLAKLP